jgi:hypothetical protein
MYHRPRFVAREISFKKRTEYNHRYDSSCKADYMRHLGRVSLSDMNVREH